MIKQQFIPKTCPMTWKVIQGLLAHFIRISKGRSNTKLCNYPYVLKLLLNINTVKLNFKHVTSLVIMIWLMTQLLLKIMKEMILISFSIDASL